MIAYVIDTLAPQVGDALISANRNLERYRRTQARAIRRCVTL